jgi:A/G-specific adenine glycosylase
MTTMTEKDRQAFRRALLDWYAIHQRDLPWRRTQDPYRIWVSEVMLQQTQVATVVPYYERFIERFPTVEALAEAHLDEVLKVWEGLGYYARVRNLREAARTVAAEHRGRVPDDPSVLRSLKGVGEYIAAAVGSIAFGAPLPVVDGNVKRVLARLFRTPQPVNHPSALKAFGEIAASLLDTTDPGAFNQAVMELGALVCTPKQPACETCPATSFCQARRHGEVSAFPKKAARKKAPTYAVAVGVIWRGDQVLVTRRKPEGLLGGLYEFPGGKIEPGEAAEHACYREIQEEVGLAVDFGRCLTTVRHAYTHFKVVMSVFECESASGQVRLNGPVDFRWCRPDELAALPFPKANNKFIPLITSGETPRRRSQSS